MPLLRAFGFVLLGFALWLGETLWFKKRKDSNG